MDISSEVNLKELYFNKMNQDGVIVLRSIISPRDLQKLNFEISQIREKVMGRIEHMDRPLKPYSDISERELGRLDYRCGFTANIFAEVGAPIAKLVREMSPQINFRCYWGVIPSLPGAGPTPWHRDVYPILSTTQGYNLDLLDINLPPYYFTVLIPLVEITKENGPTQLIKGSKHQTIVDETRIEIFAPLLKPGDVLIFDGRTQHKGSANNSKEERLIAYMTFVANWYHDQTFAINDYLFPEMSIKGQ